SLHQADSRADRATWLAASSEAATAALRQGVWPGRQCIVERAYLAPVVRLCGRASFSQKSSQLLDERPHIYRAVISTFKKIDDLVLHMLSALGIEVLTPLLCFVVFHRSQFRQHR